MYIKYGGVTFKRNHFTVYGESITTFVTPLNLQKIIHTILLWASKKSIKRILAPAKIWSPKDNVYQFQLFRCPRSLFKILDCAIDLIFVELDLNNNTIYIRLHIE